MCSSYEGDTFDDNNSTNLYDENWRQLIAQYSHSSDISVGTLRKERNTNPKGQETPYEIPVPLIGEETLYEVPEPLVVTIINCYVVYFCYTRAIVKEVSKVETKEIKGEVKKADQKKLVECLERVTFIVASYPGSLLITPVGHD